MQDFFQSKLGKFCSFLFISYTRGCKLKSEGEKVRVSVSERERESERERVAKVHASAAKLLSYVSFISQGVCT